MRPGLLLSKKTSGADASLAERAQKSPREGDRMPIKPTKRKGKPSSGTTRASSTINLSWDRPTGNFWVDTGLVVLLRHFGEGEHPIEEVLQWLQSRLRQPSGKQGEYYDELAGEIRPYDKVNWVYPTNLFIKVSGKPGKKSKLRGSITPRSRLYLSCF
jgi:hypothetical protein